MRKLMVLVLLLSGIFAGPLASAAPSPLDATIQRLYSAILHRDADASGLDYWRGESQRLSSHGVSSLAQAHLIAEALFTSAEYSVQGRDDEAYVRDVYAAYLDRDADVSGLAYWKGRLQNLPREAVRAGFISAPEHRAVATRSLNPSGYVPMDFLVDMSRGLSGHAPDEATFAAWATALRTQPCNDLLDRQVAALAVGLQATSFRGGADATYVSSLYAGLLQREPDDGGLAFWVGWLPQGGRTQLLGNFLASREFQQRVWQLLPYACSTPPPPG
jgi:hypothetical protein